MSNVQIPPVGPAPAQPAPTPMQHLASFVGTGKINGWPAIQAIFAAFPTVPFAQLNMGPPLEDWQIALKDLGIRVLCTIAETGLIKAFSEDLRRNVDLNIDNLTKPNLIQKFGEAIRDRVHTGKDAISGKYKLAEIKEFIALEASLRVLSRNDILDTGIWEVEGKIVAVGSSVAVFDNLAHVDKVSVEAAVGDKLVGLDPRNPWFDEKEITDNANDADDPKWCEAALDEAINVFRLWDNTGHKRDPDLLAAIACVMWLQTLWNWRPTIALTGPSGSGKTILMKRALAAMFGQFAYVANSPTEGALRRTTKTKGMAVFIDEFEHTNQRQKILNFLRTAGHAGTTIRCSADNEVEEHTLRHMICLAAIEMGMQDTADQNRQIRIELSKLVKDPNKPQFVVPDPEVMRKLGAKLMAVTIHYWQEIKDRAAEIQLLLANSDLDGRIVESYALPAALLGVVRQKTPLESSLIAEELMRGRESVEDHDAGGDEMQLLQDILGATVQHRGGKVLVSDLLTGRVLVDDKAQMLRVVGVRKYVRTGSPEEYLMVDVGQVRRSIFQTHERWRGELKQILLRIPGAISWRGKGVGNKITRIVLVPWQYMKDSLSDVASDDNTSTISQPRSVFDIDFENPN